MATGKSIIEYEKSLNQKEKEKKFLIMVLIS
jgi:hypothetical protein